ncbi:MAG: hypothetical protein PHW02_01335 [bacterium]|nr:hypothetical protein [bacterium]
MTFYLEFVKSNPLLAAFIQFALLGFLGEIVSYFITKKPLREVGNWLQIILKMVAWGILGIIIKYGFTGMRGFLNNLIEHNMFMYVKSGTVMYAFFLSVFTNILFGPQMMAFHRVEENIIMRRKGFEGIENSFKTLIWFWIPAHTVTFSLPADYQIGLAALWSVVLGIILGSSKKTKKQ